MATTFPFPVSPTVGQKQTLTNGQIYTWDGLSWNQTGIAPLVWRTATSNQILSSIDEDAGLIMNSANATTVTLNPNATTPYTIGRSTIITQRGTGSVTIVLGSGVTGNRRSPLSLQLNGQYAQVSVAKSATNVWEIVGDLV